MSDLKFHERDALESLFDMGGGYVLDFSNATFEMFFKDYGIDIYDSRYEDYGHSKAKRLRAFWIKESNQVVGEVLDGLIQYAKGKDVDEKQLDRCEAIVLRLLGKQSSSDTPSEKEFLDESFQFNLDKLDIDSSLKSVVEQRLDEVSKCFGASAYLSVIFLCGSTLEGLLLDVASKKPREFNLARSAPKKIDGKAKPFNEWTLSDLINVAYECRFIKKDVKDYANTLRNFRNYIHPHQQRVEEFYPDEHTAKISSQVLKASIADLGKKRQ